MLLAWLVPLCGLLGEGGTAAGTPPTSIQAWVAKLGSDAYPVRENANRQLLRAGADALDELAAAADGDDLEISIRAVRIIWRFGQSADPVLAKASLDTLASLKNNPLERQKADLALQQMRAVSALARVRTQGGELRDDYFADYLRGEKEGDIRLHLGEEWQGGDQGLELVKELRNMWGLSIHGTPITDAAIPHLASMRFLRRLELYGTRLSRPGLERLRAALPTVEIDYRAGAMLGVRGRAHTHGAEVTMVEPDSAADAAGMWVGDIIIRFNEQELHSFDDLTAQISHYQQGDRAMLRIVRGGRIVDQEITFGGWK